MSKLRNVLLATAVLVVAAVVFTGCKEQSAAPSNDQSQTANDWKSGLDEDVVAGLSEPSEEDRSVALRQEVCPVSGKTLGSMGKPLKISVEGQEVLLCCGGCEEELTNDLAKYLAKLKTN